MTVTITDNPEQERELFKYYHGTRVPLTSEREIFRSRVENRVCMVNADVVAAASSCTTFRTLSGHAGASPGVTAELLQKAVDNRLLLSYSEVENRVKSSLGWRTSHRTIQSIGVPTRNRPQMLRRLLSELADHLGNFNRRVDLLIADDSDSPGMESQNLSVLSQFNQGGAVSVRYGSRETRHRFASELARRSGVPEGVVTFALGVGATCPVSVGAARNALLLDSVDRTLLYVDDDIRCRLARIPGTDGRIFFGQGRSSTEFFPDWSDAARCQWVDDDLLKLHEDVLNVGAEAGMPHEWDLASTNAEFLGHIAQGSSSVVASMMGIVGDSALDSPLPYFLEGSDTIGHLVKSKEIYSAAMRNRIVLRGVPHATISHEAPCISYCLGVDHTRLLPPFLPVHRGEDILFGSLIKHCIPGALFGTVPRAILHQPMIQRRFDANASPRSAGRPTVPVLIAYLIAQESPIGSSSTSLLQAVGKRLETIAALDERDCLGYLRRAMEPFFLLTVQRLELLLCSGTADFWKNDLASTRDALLSRWNDPDHGVPSEYAGMGRSEAVSQFRRVLDLFAKLLSTWPELVSAARGLHAEERFICSPLAAQNGRTTIAATAHRRGRSEAIDA